MKRPIGYAPWCLLLGGALIAAGTVLQVRPFGKGDTAVRQADSTRSLQSASLVKARPTSPIPSRREKTPEAKPKMQGQTSERETAARQQPPQLALPLEAPAQVRPDYWVPPTRLPAVDEKSDESQGEADNRLMLSNTARADNLAVHRQIAPHDNTQPTKANGPRRLPVVEPPAVSRLPAVAAGQPHAWHYLGNHQFRPTNYAAYGPSDEIARRQTIPWDGNAATYHPDRGVPTSFASMLQDGADEGETDAAAGEGGEAGERREPIGRAPPEDVNLLLARDTGIVLKPGKIQTEVDLLYLFQEGLAVRVLPDVNQTPVLERVRGRLFLVPVSLRYGLCCNHEVFVMAPFGLSLLERDNAALQNTDDTGVFGDVSLGLVREFDLKAKNWNMAATFSVTAPTGSGQIQSLSGNDASLGNGTWQLSGALNFVESHDPVVTFGSIGYRYQFSKNVSDVSIERGGAITYNFGIGVAISDDFSFSTQVSGYFQDETLINGIPVPDSDIEPVSLRLSVVRRLTLKSRVQPFVDFGLNRDASDFVVGFRFIHDE